MNPKLLNELIVTPTLAALSEFDKGPGLDSPEAKVMLIAIAIQESGLRARRQMPQGPARSYWQIEPQTAEAVLGKWKPASQFCLMLSLHGSVRVLTEFNDSLACAIARGILRLDPTRLPALGDEAGAWACYNLRTWRPGKPRLEKWSLSYAAAMEAIRSSVANIDITESS